MRNFSLRLFITFILCSVLYGAKNTESVFQEEGLYATLETNKGDIVIKFTFQITPLTVCNFVGLAEGTLKNIQFDPGEPYFDGCKFHRVEADWVIQSGDPTGTGSGGPGYQFKCEVDPSLVHDKAGVVGMANYGYLTETNGSQFYITHAGGSKYDKLNGGYTIFGHTEDMDIVNAIKQGDVINKVTITRVGIEAKKFKSDQETFDNLLQGITEIEDETESFVLNNDKISISTNHGNISCKLINPGIIDIALFSVNGRELFSKKQIHAANNVTIPYSCRPGMYMIRIKQGKRVTTRKVVMQEF